MEFAIKNEFTGFAKLIPGTVDYLQAMPENDLYFIEDTRYFNKILGLLGLWLRFAHKISAYNSII